MNIVKRRFVVSLITIISLVFTMIPTLGLQKVAAVDKGESVVKTYTATPQCAVKKIEYIYNGDNTFNMKVTVDYSVYDNTTMDVDQVHDYELFINGADGRTINATAGKVDMSQDEETFGLSSSADSVKAGEDFVLSFELFYSCQGAEYAGYSDFVVTKFTAPSVEDSVSSGNFEGLKAELKTEYETVYVTYTNYTGSDTPYYDNLYRYDGKNLKCVAYQVNAGNTLRDDIPLAGSSYVYYVAKKSAADKITGLPALNKSIDVSMDDGNAVFAALKKIAGAVKLNMPAPDVEELSFDASTGVRSVTVTGALGFLKDGSTHITGFEVELKRADGKTVTEKVKIDNNVSGASKSFYIPYAGTSYIRARAYYEWNGTTYYGKWDGKDGTETALAIKSAALSAPKASITKISTKKVRITISKAKGCTGTVVYQKVGSKWKTLGSTTGSAYTTTKNTAGKRQYRFRSYVKDNGKTYYSSYSKTYSVSSNVKTFSYSSSPKAYTKYSEAYRPIKVYYSGKKVKVQGRFINTHVYRLKNVKIKLTVKCQGKTIGTKTFKSGKINAGSTKKVTVKLDKSKTGYDLRNGGLTWSYTILSAYS